MALRDGIKDHPDFVRLEVDAWGKPYECRLVGLTLALCGSVVDKKLEIRVIAPQAMLADAEDVANGLRKLGWKNAVSRIEKRKKECA